MDVIIKQINLKAIDSKSANTFIKKWHYSGKIVNNSQLHFGCFYNGKLYGVLSYGPSMDKTKIQGLVKNTGWSEFIELNRMAFDDCLPKNSESYCIAQSIKLIKKNCPQIKWIISFADATQCGHGTVYQASNFLLTGIKKNNQTILMPDGQIIARMTLSDTRNNKNQRYFDQYKIKYTGGASLKSFFEAGAKVLEGFQIRYIYFIDRDKIKDLNVPILPYSEIEKQGAKMYKGQKATSSIIE